MLLLFPLRLFTLSMLLVVASTAIIINAMHESVLTLGVTAPAFIALCSYFWYQVMVRVLLFDFDLEHARLFDRTHHSLKLNTKKGA